jgi:asparagine synthase (glutamine-hydrolysing)
MCGFTGFLNLSHRADEPLGAVVCRMAATLHHRGPDDVGVWIDDQAGIALGFRRLSILDLSPEGHQPMLSAGGRYVLAFNGEIYNFADVRRELQGSASLPAPTFRGHSDTEIMLAAIERWGLVEAARRFVGMFAFALWDRQERSLCLGRDRLGEKPLYYGWCGDTFLFGSELKALRAHPRFHGEVDREALFLYVRMGSVPSPRAIYRGVSKLPPGTILTLRRPQAGQLPSPVPYWEARPGDGSPDFGGEERAADALESLLVGAVKQQMVADVPVGAFLSGGIDSSLVVALMQQQSARQVKTYTIGFHEDGYDEAGHARAVARHLNTEHTELYVSPAEARDVIPLLPEVYDEPFADSSAIPVFLVSRLARRSVTVCLSGDGGDELFAGYPWYPRTMKVWRRLRWAPRALRRTAAGFLSLPSSRGWDRALGLLSPVLPSRLRERVTGNRIHTFAELLRAADSPEQTHRWLLSKWHGYPSLVRGADCGTGATVVSTAAARSRDLLQAVACLDLRTYLPDDILTKVDRASMAVSLEARAPFLDHRVVEFALSVPAALKVRDGRGKWLLRQVLYRHVPAELIDRPKKGFSVPVGEWLRGPLRGWAEDLLAERRLREEGFFDPAPVRQKWAEHLSGRHGWGDHLWHVLMFQAWLAANGSETRLTGGGNSCVR